MFIVCTFYSCTPPKSVTVWYNLMKFIGVESAQKSIIGLFFASFKSKREKEGKGQELIQSSTTLDPRNHIGTCH